MNAIKKNKLMSIQDFIDQCLTQEAEIKEVYPNTSNITFKLENVPLVEMQMYADETNKKVGMCPWDETRMYLYVNMLPVIIILSKPLKITQPVMIEEAELA